MNSLLRYVQAFLIREERIFQEYSKKLFIGHSNEFDKLEAVGDIQYRLERLTRALSLLEAIGRKLSATTEYRSEILENSEQSGKLKDSNTVSDYGNLDDLLNIILEMQYRASSIESKTNKMIDISNEILMDTSELTNQNQLGKCKIQQGELVC